jgi:hypothetical protein
MPFGPFKASVYGQELGNEALEQFSQCKMVYREMGEVKDEDTFFHLRRPTLRRLNSHPSGRRYFSSQRSAWWSNPFASFGVRDKAPQLATPTISKDAFDDDARKLQERKDATLVLLATQYRQVSMDNPQLDREQKVNAAFDRLEELNVDSKTIPQLRHTLQSSLEPQVVHLLRLFHRIDEELLYFELVVIVVVFVLG